MLEDRLDQAAIDLPTIMHQRDRRVRHPPNHRLNTAEDLAEVISLNESVTVPYSSFSNCLKTKETSSLEPDLLEYKFYCPGVGLVLTIDAATGERSELIAKKP